MRTQIDERFLRDRVLTGASLIDEIGIYDETKSYSVGDVVFYNGRFYKATTTIPAGSKEGDLQNAPTSNTNWVEVFKVRSLENTYQAGQSITLPRNGSENIVQVFKKHNAQNNVDVTPIPLTSDNFDYYQFFTLVNNYLKLKDSVKYYTTYENNLYHKFQLFTNDYVNIYDINATDS